jgi:hypothetical protein
VDLSGVSIPVRVGMMELAIGSILCSILVTTTTVEPHSPMDRGPLHHFARTSTEASAVILRPSVALSFFVTSVGKHDGGNLGGLSGADAHCRMLAAAVDRGDIAWHAYLSTQGTNAVNARDRIGNGPWFNANGERVATDVPDLHGERFEPSRVGQAIDRRAAINEQGEQIPEDTTTC